ncbi:MAG: hypothetical protein HQL43_16010 [Alphaproteobacteria bacterium]|nr:hypothetical protein [Alphaproteobacteria bacterium]
MSPAHQLPGGSLVRYQGRLWLKAERPAKDYINHYLVPAQPEPGLSLLYIDPETELELVAVKARPNLGTARAEGGDIPYGDLIETPGGPFIKAQDIKKDGQRHAAYVDIRTGEVRPRQERQLLAAYGQWKLEI